MYFLFRAEKKAAKIDETVPMMIPVLYLVSKWKIIYMPNRLSNPKKNSPMEKRVLLNSGSVMEVNKPTDAKHTNPTDTLDSLMLP